MVGNVLQSSSELSILEATKICQPGCGRWVGGARVRWQGHERMR